MSAAESESEGMPLEVEPAGEPFPEPPRVDKGILFSSNGLVIFSWFKRFAVVTLIAKLISEFCWRVSLTVQVSLVQKVQYLEGLAKESARLNTLGSKQSFADVINRPPMDFQSSFDHFISNNTLPFISFPAILICSISLVAIDKFKGWQIRVLRVILYVVLCLAIANAFPIDRAAAIHAVRSIDGDIGKDLK